MDLAAGAAGSLFAHLPEVVFFGAFQDAVFGYVFFPVAVGFGVHVEAVFVVASEDGDVEVVLVDVHHFGEEFPAEGDGFALEIVAERPVAEHLEHGVVVGVVAYFFKVVVFAADAETFLGVAGAGIWRVGIAEEDVFELVHARVGEHEGGVVFHNHGSRGDYVVTFAFEEFEELCADFVTGHARGELKGVY